jgi:hypothetical protein
MAQRLSKTSSGQVKKALVLLLDHPNYAIKIYAIRGVAYNHFSDLRGKLQDMEKREQLDQVKQEAKAALEKL